MQQAMQLLPESQWGVVVANNTELYPKVGVYAAQLRALEQAVRENRDQPALRFLVGYHYGYLGHLRHGAGQLQKAQQLAPQDQLAKQLLDRFVGSIDGRDRPAEERKPAAPRPDTARDL